MILLVPLVTQLILAREPITKYLTIRLVAPLRSGKHQHLGGYWRRRQNGNRKGNIMKKSFVLICVATLLAAYAQGSDHDFIDDNFGNKWHNHNPTRHDR